MVECGDGAQECGCCYGCPEGHERFGAVSLFEGLEVVLTVHKLVMMMGGASAVSEMAVRERTVCLVWAGRR